MGEPRDTERVRARLRESAEASKGTASVAARTVVDLTQSSRDDLSRANIFFDLEDKSNVPKWIKYLNFLGAKCSAFLDKDVTHFITDRASRIAAQYNRSLQWGFNIWRLDKFVECLGRQLEGKGVKTGSLSPVLRSGKKKRDLQQYLEEEDQGRLKVRPKVSTPTTTTAPSATMVAAPTSPENLFEWREFQNPVVIIEDLDCRYAPIIKEYDVASAGSDKKDDSQPSKHPIFYWNSQPGHCPFMEPKEPTHPSNCPLPLECIRAPSGKKAAGSIVTRSRAAMRGHPAHFVKVTRRIQWAATSGKPRPGFCECCWERYSDLDKHTTGFHHRQYAADSINYEKLDALLTYKCRRQYNSTGLFASVVPAAPISPEKSSNSLVKCIDLPGGGDENGITNECRAARGYTASKRRKLQSLTLFQTGDSTPAFPDDSQTQPQHSKASLILSANRTGQSAVPIPSSPSKRVRSRRQDLPVNRRLFVV